MPSVAVNIIYAISVAVNRTGLVVQLQRNGHANISCILSSGQSNTHIGQEVLIKRMTQNDSQFLLVGWTTNWLTYRRGSARTGYPLGRLLYRTRAE